MWWKILLIIAAAVLFGAVALTAVAYLAELIAMGLRWIAGIIDCSVLKEFYRRKNMRTFKALGDIACVLLACIGVVIICAFVYYSIFNEDITIGVNNIDDQVALDIIEKIEKENDLTPEQIDKYKDRYFMNFNYYDTTNGISWNGTNNGGSSIATELKRSTQFIIKIDNRPFAIQLSGSINVDVGDVRNLFGIGWKVGDKYQTFYYTYGEVFKTVLKAVKTNSVGYGDYYITVDLSNLFTIREYDRDTGKFKGDNVTDIIKNYAVLKFHYEDNGAISSSQSMFGLIENNRKFAVGEGVDYDTTYWQERMVYNLTEKDLSLRYSSIYNGYFLSLSLATKNVFENMPRSKVNIVLDLIGKNIVGFDYNAFENFEIDTIRLTGNQTFYLLEKSLFNSNVKTFDYSSGIVIVNNNSGVEI